MYIKIPQSDLGNIGNYKLGDPSIVPDFFGEVSKVNIFIGENNSGKSRYMRSILRQNNNQYIYNEDQEEIQDILESIAGFCNLLINNCKINIKLSVSNIISFKNIFGANKAKQLLGDSNEYLFSSEIFSEIRIQAINIALELNTDLSSMLKNIYTLAELNTFASLLEYNTYVDFIIDLFFYSFYSHEYYGEGNIIESNDLYSISSEKGYDLIFDKTEKDSRNLSEIVYEYRVIIINIKQKTLQLTSLIKKIEGNIINTKKIYIPTLRTARTLLNGLGKKVVDDLLLTTTAKDYGLENLPHVTIETGLNLYKSIRRSRNSERAVRKNFEIFENFLSTAFFDGKQVEIIAKDADTSEDEHIVVYIDQEERDVRHLGDGIQSLIILLYPIFMAEEGSWFFIEEPELNLHPGLQKLFTSTILFNDLIKEKGLTFFLTTHSNHIIDTLSSVNKDISVFSFQKSTKLNEESLYEIKVSYPRDNEILSLLGVSNSSVFLSNCTIWVEGITDRIYARSYLNAYIGHLGQINDIKHSLIEGLHYSFVEYAGSNLSHYTFLKDGTEVPMSHSSLVSNIMSLSISSKIFLIADKDSNKDKKHSNFLLQQHKGFVYYILPVREIENALSPCNLCDTLKIMYPKLNFELKTIEKDNYENVYIGEFLCSKYNKIPKSFKEKSGTISSGKKRFFSEIASNSIKWENMTNCAKELSVSMFNFIVSHNTRLS